MKPRHRKTRFGSFCVCISFFVFVAFLHSEDVGCLLSRYRSPTSYRRQTADSNSQRHGSDCSYSEAQLRHSLKLDTYVPFSIGKATHGCDIFSGRWVRDNVSHPMYEEQECPYIQPQLTCKEHGRPDSDYRHWRWQPHSCSLPKFNGTLMLESLRGKRMMFVGDSLNRGQYVSMLCLLHSFIPQHEKSIETRGSLTIFKAQNYNATIEFYWAPFLLESNSDDAAVHRIADRVVRAGSIRTHARHWKGAEIIVFNTYLWWLTGLDMKILKSGSFGNDTKEIVELKTEDAYRMALYSVAKWVEEHMDPNKTRVFFTSMSPTHELSKEWGSEKEGNGYNETEPIYDPNYWGSSSRKSMMRVIGDVFGKMSVPISFLNITQLSLYRKDAHTSIYKKQWSPLTPEQLANPVSYADCTHWCLPGLQDTWNELLYTKLFFP